MVAPILVGVKIGFQKIGEKENFQDGKHYKQFNQDDNPYLLAPFAHIFKSIEIKSPDPVKDIFGFFGHSLKINFYKLNVCKKCYIH